MKEKVLVVDGIARVHKELNPLRPEAHLMRYGLDGKGMFALCGFRGWVSNTMEGDSMCQRCQRIVDSHGGWDAVIDMEGLTIG